MIEVTELPEAQLMKSKTYRQWIGQFGRCTKCHEMTEILNPCCGARVNFEGGDLSWEDLWSDIEEELLEEARPDY